MRPTHRLTNSRQVFKPPEFLASTFDRRSPSASSIFQDFALSSTGARPWRRRRAESPSSTATWWLSEPPSCPASPTTSSSPPSPATDRTPEPSFRSAATPPNSEIAPSFQQENSSEISVLEFVRLRFQFQFARVMDWPQILCSGLCFVCYYKFQLGRSTQMGSHGGRIPSGTLSLIVEGVDRSHGEGTDCSIDDSRVVYTVFQPDTSIRVLLQGNENSNELEICLESGNYVWLCCPSLIFDIIVYSVFLFLFLFFSDEERLGTTSLVLIAAGLNPFDVINYSLE